MKEKTNNASAQVEISPGLKVIANTASGPPEVFPWEKSRDLKTTITTTLAELAATRDRMKKKGAPKAPYSFICLCKRKKKNPHCWGRFLTGRLRVISPARPLET